MVNNVIYIFFSLLQIGHNILCLLVYVAQFLYKKIYINRECMRYKALMFEKCPGWQRELMGPHIELSIGP